MQTGLYTVGLDDQGDTVMVAAGSKESRADQLASRRHAKLLEQHNRNEARLARAMRAWDKSRAALRRAEARLDKQWASK